LDERGQSYAKHQQKLKDPVRVFAGLSVDKNTYGFSKITQTNSYQKENQVSKLEEYDFFH
jgi:hypothetical protein